MTGPQGMDLAWTVGAHLASVLGFGAILLVALTVLGQVRR